MPALKMKCKTSTGRLREGPNLHVHCSSTMISKGQYAPVRTFQQAKVHEFVQLSQKASSNGTSDEHGRHTEVDCQDSCYEAEACDHTSGSLVPSSDTVSTENVHCESACPQILETIFSPILEQNEADDKSSIESDEAYHPSQPSYPFTVVDDENTELPHLVADDSDDSSCSSSEHQSCSITDFNISDLIVPAYTFDGSTGFADIISGSSPDYDHINSDLLYDMEERCMLFPFDERSLATNSTLDVYDEERVMNTDESLLHFAIHQLKKSDHEDELNCQNSNMEEGEWFDPHFFIKMPEISDMVSSIFPLPLQMEIGKKTVTLVLDLDETLVHSTLDCCGVADFSFPVFFNMKEHIVYVRQRPYLHLFLERVSQMFEVVIFTASQSIYAEKLLDTLDPNKKLISHRFYRESCVFSEGSYTKDLTILGVDLAKVAIIDNSPQVFRLQVNNGIPIKSWFDDPSDNALITLLPFLEGLALAEDVRPIIAKRFNNKEE